MLYRYISAGLLVGVLFLVGCAGMNYKSMSAAAIYDVGQKHFEKKKWKEAQDAFEKLKEIHPFSVKVTPAELRIAECMYQKREYAEATVAFEEFLLRHPTNSEVPRAVYYLGLTNYDQMLSIDRDQTFTKEAYRQFQRLVTRHADDPYAQKAKEKYEDTRNRLAKRERYVGVFYWKQREYYSALGRFETVIEDFSDTDFFEEALYFAARCHLKLSDPESAERQLKRLLMRFPDGRYAAKAQSLLTEIQTQPDDRPDV